ncbi:MAG TPA: heme o synthase [Candidatus Deferrimicrobium sp.]|nr:heme o synthase [Candidatus Deferrimicrobium sp.]
MNVDNHEATAPAAVQSSAYPWSRRERTHVAAVVRHYLQLTKPSIMLLVLFTGAVAWVVERSRLSDLSGLALFLAGLFLTGGSANALNQYFERELDARMSRTRRSRPLPLGRISPTQALVFAVAIGILGVVLLSAFFNWLTAGLAAATILFYSLWYTLWLKPSTTLNIVIGGAAGAMAPVGAWTAATGSMALLPWALFLIIFLWTPPHFWALALLCREDYAKVNLPMLPVVMGEKATLVNVFRYTVVLVVASFSLVALGASWLYLGMAIVLGGIYLRKVRLALRVPTPDTIRGLFRYSLVYLFALFLALALDSLILR